MVIQPLTALLMPFFLLWLAVVGLWLPNGRCVGLSIGSLSILSALYAGVISAPALLPIFALAGSGYLVAAGMKRYPRWVPSVAAVAVLGLSAALSLHATPGFNNILIVQDLEFAQDSIPYSLYWNYDKGVLGLLLLALCVDINRSSVGMARAALTALGITGALIVIVMPFSMAFDLTRVDPKLPTTLIWWAPANLFNTCVAEEAIFRGIVQHRLGLWLKERVRHGLDIAVVVAAILFGLAHAGAGATFVVMACIAGLGYGIAYRATGRIEASIATHFLFNFVHFTFFSYPMLQASSSTAIPQ